MAEITASSIKDLREKTGAGMMDCKKALVENNGDFEAAVDWLRKKGLAAAAKKSGRTAAQGLVGIKVEGNKGAVIELNSETDFVARNDKFQLLVQKVTEVAFSSNGNLDTILQAAYPATGRTVSNEIAEHVSVIGENMSLRRTAILQAKQGVVVGYVHNSVATNMGKIGVLVALESAAASDKLQALGKQLAMHIAASNPSYLAKEDITEHALSVERDAANEKINKFIEKYATFEKTVAGYSDRMTGERAFSEKIIETKLDELAQTASMVGELLSDYDRQSKSEDRKEKQDADKTKKLLDVFFQEANYLLKKVRSYGNESATRQRLSQMKLDRFIEEVVLLEQAFVIDGKTKISDVLVNATKELGSPVLLGGFIRFELGEGIEQEKSDFAEEVAAIATRA